MCKRNTKYIYIYINIYTYILYNLQGISVKAFSLHKQHVFMEIHHIFLFYTREQNINYSLKIFKLGLALNGIPCKKKKCA